MRTIQVRESESGQRLDKFLKRYFSAAGSGFLYKMLRKKNILLNEKKASGGERLEAGDRIRVYFSDETFEKMKGQPQKKAVPKGYLLQREDILYEDENVIAVNKKAGVLSQGSAKGEAGEPSLPDALKEYLIRTGALDPEDFHLFHPAPANRLDRNTSGIILAGKNLRAQSELSRLIRERSMKKFYLTLAAGRLEEERRESGYLQKDEKENRVHFRKEPADGAKRIETVFRPVRFVDTAAGECTLLEAELITGRSHQIRVQLAAIGHPVMGDEKYGNHAGNRMLRKSSGLVRQFLHAYRICFPETEGYLGKLSGLEIRSELPDDLKRVIGTSQNPALPRNGMITQDW